MVALRELRPIFYDMQGVRRMKQFLKVGDKVSIMRTVRRDTEHGIRVFELPAIAEIVAKYPHIVHTTLGDVDYNSIAIMNQGIYNDAQRMGGVR